jgi:hypothetical protein
MSVARTSQRRRTTAPTPEEYSAFIGQIELLDIWLTEAHIRNQHGRRAPGRSGIAFMTPDPTWVATDGGFDVRFPYVVRFADGDTVHAELSITFGLNFSSGQPMTQAIFEVFKHVNLPVNTWPFLREFVSASLGRMGWEPFTLPALKVGAANAANAEKPERATAPKRRQRTRDH